MGSTILENLKCGNMILLNAQKEDVKNACFFIKETTANLDKIGKSPTVEARAVVFEAKEDKILLLILFRFNGDDKSIYGQWCNYYNPSQRKSLDILAKESKLTFNTLSIYNESYATFQCDNPLKEKLEQCGIETKGHKWSPEEFRKYATSANSYFGGPVSLFKASNSFNRFKAK